MHNNPISPNLLQRQFNVSKPDQYWVGDITYIPTSKGRLYLAAVIDLYSRQVVGWSMSNRMQADLVNDALLMAIWKRKPEKGLIWHTDRGSQYASYSHRKLLKEHHIIQSMSRKGDCWDNAVAESFFHTLKTELTHHHKFKNREEAKYVIFEYIEVFIIVSEYIQLITICRLWSLNKYRKSLKKLSVKLLPDQNTVG